MALRSGAGGPAEAGTPTLRSVRGIFRHVHAATKNDPFLSAAVGGGNQEGAPAPSWTLPGTVGRGTGARWGACFCRGCLLSGSPRSGIAGGRAAAAAGRETRGRAHALRCAPGDEGRETGDGRGRSAARLGTRDERRGTGADAPPRAWERGTRDGGIGSAPAHRAGAVFIFFGPGSGRFGRGSGGRARRRQLPGSAPPAESAGAG